LRPDHRRATSEEPTVLKKPHFCKGWWGLEEEEEEEREEEEEEERAHTYYIISYHIISYHITLL
jgi:hypothetical protein